MSYDDDDDDDSLRHVKHRYIWLPLLRLTHDGGVHLGLSS